jgi:transposase
MENVRYSVGIDVSSDKFNVCMVLIDDHQKIKIVANGEHKNTLNGFKNLESWIQKHQKEKTLPLSICMEVTGVYYEELALYLSEKNYTISVVPAHLAKSYIKSKGYKSKNDKIDAKGLAEMGAERKLKDWHCPTRFYYGLKKLTRMYQSLQESKTVFMNQLHALRKSMYKSELAITTMEKLIKVVQKDIEELKKEIVKYLKSDKEIYSKICKLKTIPGIGILTIAVILAETNGFEIFSNHKQLVSFVGYDIIENQSGNHHGKTRISKKGNSRIRRAMYMPALTTIRVKCKVFVDLYERTLSKHNIKMKSYVAVQKKLLTTMYFLWKKNVAFDPNHQINNKIEKITPP